MGRSTSSKGLLFLCLFTLFGEPGAWGGTYDGSVSLQMLPGQIRRLDETHTILPVYLFADLSAYDLTSSVGMSPEVGALTLTSSLFGFVDTLDLSRSERGEGEIRLLFVRFTTSDRRGQVTLGRQVIYDSAALADQIDGGSVRLHLPHGFGAVVWGGVPVARRLYDWDAYSRERSYDWSAGGRISAAFAGGEAFMGRMGVSYVAANDRGALARREAGADLLLFPTEHTELSAVLAYDLVTPGIRDLEGGVGWQPGWHEMRLRFEVRARSPIRYLPKTSIFSVFDTEDPFRFGPEVSLLLVDPLRLTMSYHRVSFGRGEDAVPGVDMDGDLFGIRLEWRVQRFIAGGEVHRQVAPENGYVQWRLFLRRSLSPASYAALDWDAYRYDEGIEGDHRDSSNLSGSLGFDFGGGWNLLAGLFYRVTPFASADLSGNLRLVYQFPGGR